MFCSYFIADGIVCTNSWYRQPDQVADVSTFMENGKSNVVSDVSSGDVASEVANNLELPDFLHHLDMIVGLKMIM